jgi:hypothetical protein
MTEMKNSNKKRGLTIGIKTPHFSTIDIDHNKVTLEGLLKENKGILIDFFRGSW